MDLSMVVNGQVVPIDGTAHENLLDALRVLGLTGCKEGCAEGECGACAVLVGRTSDAPGIGTEWSAVNACLVPTMQFDGATVVSSEGLSEASLHPVASAIAEGGGSQCGFCTPGFVCAAAAEFYRADRHPDHFDTHALSGNLCRCTGYRPIKEAVEALPLPAPDDELLIQLEGTSATRRPFHVKRCSVDIHRPADLAETLDLMSDSEIETRLVAGATDHGVEVNLGHRRPRRIVHIAHLDELRTFDPDGTSLRLGAAVTLHDLDRGLGDRVPLLTELWPQFASHLIRARATLGGNLGTGSPIGDAAPALLALDAELVLADRQGTRTVPLAEYFTGYRTSVRRRDELITEVLLPQDTAPPPERRIERFIKISKRRFDDISSTAVAVRVDLDRDGVVSRARIGVGGMAATPLRAHHVEDALVGLDWTPGAVRTPARLMRDLGTPIDDHRASAAYRSAMAEQALLKVCVESMEGAS